MRRSPSAWAISARVEQRGSARHVGRDAARGSARRDLIPGQYGVNVETVPGTGKRVEFALRVPGRSDEPACWIPIDSKFPVEEWERLQDALERANSDAAEAARKALSGFLRQQARTVRANYVAPPHTSDFAFLYLPTESLYAEMMSRPGLADELHARASRDDRRPHNFLALLNTRADGIPNGRHRAALLGVWLTLGPFDRIPEIRRRSRAGAEEAARTSNTVEEARAQDPTIERRLREVEGLPETKRPPPDRASIGRLFEDGVAETALASPGALTQRARVERDLPRRQWRILRRAAIPDVLWREASTAALPRYLRFRELGRLREKVVLFLPPKAIVGARGHEVTPLAARGRALEACVSGCSSSTWRSTTASRT